VRISARINSWACRHSILTLAFVSCAPALFGQDAAGVDAARRREQEVLILQRALILQQRAMLGAAQGARPRMPLEWFTVDVEPDGEDPGERQVVRRARIGADWLELAFFGQAESALMRSDLEKRLSHEVEWLEQTYGMSAAQQQKLVLAGRGDIKRQFELIDVIRQKARSLSVDAADIQKLVDLQNTLLQEAAAWRKKLIVGQFGDETLFAKALKRVLTPEQVARQAEWVRTHPVVVTRSWDLKVTR